MVFVPVAYLFQKDTFQLNEFICQLGSVDGTRKLIDWCLNIDLGLHDALCSLYCIANLHMKAEFTMRLDYVQADSNNETADFRRQVTKKNIAFSVLYCLFSGLNL